MHSLALHILEPTTFTRVQNLKTGQQLWPLGHQRRTKNAKDRAIEISQKSTFFVFVTGVFWGQRFVCCGQRYENAKSSNQNDKSEEDEKPLINFLSRWAIALAFTATAQLTPGPKFSEDNNDATNGAGIQKHL